MKKRNKSNQKKEKLIMLLSSVFVLSALTVTGVYVKEKNAQQDDSYIVDLSELSDDTTEKADDIAVKTREQENDLDYDPNFREANSGEIENPGLTQVKTAEEEEAVILEEAAAPVEEAPAAEKPAEEKPAEEVEAQVAQAISFSERDMLQWPIAGNVLLNYSMDKTIFFATLQQYKYNPAIVIAAKPGENITAASAGMVEKIYTDDEIGQTIVMNLGNGYELTYGQLQEIAVKEGDYVDAGELLATVAEPTKYYSVEGSNVYFKLTKDGVPVDPLSRLD